MKNCRLNKEELLDENHLLVLTVLDMIDEKRFLVYLGL